MVGMRTTRPQEGIGTETIGPRQRSTRPQGSLRGLRGRGSLSVPTTLDGRWWRSEGFGPGRRGFFSGVIGVGTKFGVESSTSPRAPTPSGPVLRTSPVSGPSPYTCAPLSPKLLDPSSQRPLVTTGRYLILSDPPRPLDSHG